MPYKSRKIQREYQAKWKSARRKEFFKDKICINCGSDRNLELHHRNPEEKISHNIWSWSLTRRLIEIAKCDVLCKSCHQEITYN